MKKKLLLGSLALVLSTSLLAESHWYIGAEYGSGSGDRAYDSSLTVGFNSSAATVKVGHMNESYDKVELQYTAKTLENENNAADSDDVAEYKINFVTSIMKLSYEEMVIPYFEVALGYGDSTNFGGQFATHLGLGVMVNPIEAVEVSVGYRLSTSIGSTDNSVSYADQHGDLIVGAAYKF